MSIKCPSCGSELCSFAMLYMTMPLKKYGCSHCGERFKAKKTGRIKYTSYLLGALVGVLIGLVRCNILPAFYLVGIIPIFGVDILVDFRNKDLIKFVPVTSNNTLKNTKKQLLLSLVLIIIGMIVGTFVAVKFFSSSLRTYIEINEMADVASIEGLVHEIYKNGDYKTSVIALNYLVKQLEMHAERTPKSPNHKGFISDQGLTHARLFLVYEKNGKQDLANQEYQKAITVFGNKLSKEQLKKIIERLDAIKVKP